MARLSIEESRLWTALGVCMGSGILIGFGLAAYLGYVWGVL